MASSGAEIAEPLRQLTWHLNCFKNMSSILKLRQICPQPKFCPETIVWTKLRVELEGTKYLFGDSDDAEHFFLLWKLLSQ